MTDTAMALLKESSSAFTTAKEKIEYDSESEDDTKPLRRRKESDDNDSELFKSAFLPADESQKYASNDFITPAPSSLNLKDSRADLVSGSKDTLFSGTSEDDLAAQKKSRIQKSSSRPRLATQQETVDEESELIKVRQQDALERKMTRPASFIHNDVQSATADVAKHPSRASHPIRNTLLTVI